MPSWVSRTVLSGSSVTANGTSSHTCTFTPATSGNFLVAIMGGAVTFTTPAGWTLGESAVNNAGLYVFYKTASSSESSFSTTHNGADYAIEGVVYEFPAGTSFLASNSQTAMFFNSNNTGPTVSGLTGTYTRFAARTAIVDATNGTASHAWTIPSIEDYDAYVARSTNDGIELTIAYDDNQAGSSFTPSGTMTTTNITTSNGEGIAFALALAPANTSGLYLSNNANGGTNGATVTYYNCGETSGDAWDYISIGAGATATYSTQNARGGMSYRFTTGASANQVMVEWEKFITPLSAIYVRFNVFLPAYVASSTRFCEINDGTTTMLTVGIRSDGILSMRDYAGAQMAVTTVPLPIGRWCRIEFQATSSPTTGQINLRTYREVDSPYPTENVSSAASFNTQPNGIGFNKTRFGLTGISVANATCYMDDIAVSSSGYLGPANASANGPLLHRNGAETGANGVAIDTTNMGDRINASFDLTRGPDPITFSNVQAAHGTLSYRILPTAGQESFFIWSRAATSAMAARFYVYFTGFPGSLEEFGQLTTTDAVSFTSLARLVFTPTNNLRVLDSTGANLWTSSSPMAINTWYRFEIYGALGGTATTGTIQAAYYALDSTTAIDSFSTTSANLGTANFGYLRIGKIGSSSWNTAMYVDDIAQQQQASGLIGPYTAPPAAPAAYPGIIPHKGWGIRI